MTNYDLDNEQLYSKKLLEKRAFKLFITIPHTDIDKEELLQVFRDYSQVSYCKIAEEHHEDGDTHLHILLSFKQQVRYGAVHNKIKSKAQGKRIIGAVNYQVPKSMAAVSKYIDKEENTVEFGELKGIGQGHRSDLCDTRNAGAAEAIELAQSGDIEGARQVLLEAQPMRMLENGETIMGSLKALNTTRKKFKKPIFNSGNTELKLWQQQLLSLVKETPKERRIIWVVGEPGSGKSFMFNYLSNIDNYEYGIYNAGQCVSMDNLVYGYDEEGIIAWDFPLNFQFNNNDNLTGHIANVIEKFSDFGQTVSSKKYKGCQKDILGHCVVFSNREPLEELMHRDIVVIRAVKEEVKEVCDDTWSNAGENIDISDCVSVDENLKTFDFKTFEKEKDITLRHLDIKTLRHNEREDMDKIERLRIRYDWLVSNDINKEEQDKIYKRMKELMDRNGFEW